MLRRLARLSYHRRRPVLALWLIALLAAVGLASVAGGVFEDEFELPGSESQRAADLLADGGFATQAGFQGQLVVHAPAGVEADEVREPVAELLDRIGAQVPDVTVTSPYDERGRFQVSEDGTIASAQLEFAPRGDRAYADATSQVADLVEATDVAAAELELAGDRFVEPTEGGASEGIGLLGAVVVLLVAFGSLLAMGLPIVTALLGIGTGAALVTVLANVITMPSFTIQLVLMLGIGVGIDYALFIVTRYRESLADGVTPAAAVETAMDTAGRAVFFAGTTVVISVLGLVVVGLDVNRALGIAAASGVAMTMLASLTLLPALLGFVGENIDRLGLPHRRRATNLTGGVWHRWSRTIQARPVLPAGLALLVLVLLAVPAFDMRLGFGDAGNRPTEDTTRRAYDLLAEGFGPGANGPLILAASTPDDEARDRLDGLVATLEGTDGVAGTTGAVTSEDGEVAFLQVFPTTSPQDEATTDLVHHLRDEVLPHATADSSLRIHVGGAAAAVVDFADFNGDRLPVFIAVVLTLSFLVLMMVFRSILVPLKAVLMNLLSIGAAYGAIVAVFQWGWGADLIGAGEPGPIEAWAPLMLFAIVFGLSMDYEVFLLSRIREIHEETGDNAEAVAQGLAATARVISAAAAIMVVVFAGFVFSGERSLQMFGLGLAVAVAVDATLVRLVVVPSTMEMLGERNWWLPSWLDRVLPRIHVESAPGDDAATDDRSEPSPAPAAARRDP